MEASVDSSVEVSPRQESQDYEPPARRGAGSFVYNGCFHLHNGYSPGTHAFTQSPDINLEVLDLHHGVWSSVETKVSRSLPENISGACCTITNGNLYVFGGWLAGLRNAEVHELNLESLVWKHLPAKNPHKGPFCKDKAGMFSYGPHMVGVFGGYGYPIGHHRVQTGAVYHRDPVSFGEMICWTNELHLFHVERCEL